jgi:antitoxin component YwqK of YwqJK toxin-antitoxin module
MNRDTFYKSTIPPEATARPIGKYRNGNPKRIEYYIGKELVGLVHYQSPGVLSTEVSYRNGKRHGWEYQWYAQWALFCNDDYESAEDNLAANQLIPAEAIARVDQTYRDGSPMRTSFFVGEIVTEYVLSDGETRDKTANLLSATPYEDGIEHGTAYQWSHDGLLIGTYAMVNGTGTDLWWQEADGEIVLTKAHRRVNNRWDGYEWWFNNCRPSELSIEKWWLEGELHGIERKWNLKARIRRGWPKYWIHNQQVDKRKYLRAAAKDPTLLVST